MIAASCTGSCRPVAEDSHVPPLPRRAPDDRRPVPGGKPGGGSGLAQPLVLPESLQQRILTALDCGEDEAPPPERDALHEAEASREAEASPGPPASLPRRVPGANNGPEPPAQIAPPALLSSRVPPRPAEAAPRAEIAARPGPPFAVSAEPPPVPAQRRPAEQQPDRHDGRGGGGNGSRPSVPMTRAAMWAYFEHAEAPTGPLPVIPAETPGEATEKIREWPGP